LDSGNGAAVGDVNGLDTNGVKVPPALGDKWRLNMFRMDSPKDAKSQIALGWSPPMVGDFHKLDRFGEIVFVDENVRCRWPRRAPAKGVKKDETKPAGKTAEKKPAKKALARACPGPAQFGQRAREG